MAKTISAQMQAHLASEVTSLATCWKITRRDGTIIRITDHDADITFGGEEYLASIGVSRSAVQDKSDMSVDNMELAGIIDSNVITDEDIRGGRYDYAEAECFMVNHEDPDGFGDIKLRKGTIGEVQANPIIGSYTAEFRGLLDRFAQNTINVYQSECRVDLGSTKCGVLLEASEVLRSTAYEVGDVVSVDASATTTIATLATIDPAPADPDWVFSAEFSTVVTDTNAALVPQWGTYLFDASNAAASTTESYVEADVTAYAAAIDGGVAVVDFSGAVGNNFADDDAGEFIFTFYDADDVEISQVTTGQISLGAIGWASTTTVIEIIPALTRTVRLTLKATKEAGGSIINVCFDIERFDILATAPSGPDGQRFGGLQYVCTVAGTTDNSQPVYDTIIGNDTVDGTATFTCEYSFTQYVTVDTVVNNRTFTITAPGNDTIAIDNWFKYGRVVFLDGQNSFKAYQVKKYTQLSKQVELLIAAPYPIQMGDVLKIQAGCGKTIETYCRDKFDNVINFRGEPFIPGSNQFLRYPDAKG